MALISQRNDWIFSVDSILAVYDKIVSELDGSANSCQCAILQLLKIIYSKTTANLQTAKTILPLIVIKLQWHNLYNLHIAYMDSLLKIWREKEKATVNPNNTVFERLLFSHSRSHASYSCLSIATKTSTCKLTNHRIMLRLTLTLMWARMLLAG